MSQMVAIELARLLEQGVPSVKARAVGLSSGFAVVALCWSRGKAHPIIIKDTTEFSLLLAFLELKAEQAGRPLAPVGRTIEERRVRIDEREPVYQY